MKCKLCKDTGWIGNFLCVCQTLLIKIFPIFLLIFFTQCTDKSLESAYAKQDLILLMKENQEKFTLSEAHLLLSGHVKNEEIKVILGTFTGKWSTSKCPSFNKSVLYSRLENDHNTELIQKIQQNAN